MVKGEFGPDFNAFHANTVRVRNWLAAGLLCLVASGCSLPLQSQRLGEWEVARQSTELTATPFFPQERYQCGPAALATVLSASGVAVSPDALRDQVYLPGREGSLQAEILAAARRHDRIPYPLQPQLEELLQELRDGHPILVLQNLGLSWAPRWHYAVVVGFDAEREEILLRSGTIQRHRMPVALFERTWRRGRYWAVRILRPGELPSAPDEQRYLSAVVPLEQLQKWKLTAEAYQAALIRWPDNLTAWMGLGNSHYADGELDAAIAAFRHAVALHPEAAVAYNNLAYALAQSGRLQEARGYAERAVELDGGANPEFQATLAEIRAQQ